MGILNCSEVNLTGLKLTSNLSRHVSKMGTTLLSGVTWGNADDLQSKLLGNINGANTAGCYAIIVTLYYQHNGSTNHGYLTGYFHQTGKDYTTHGTWFNSYHYDWYYNVITTDHIIPWDPDGTQTVSVYNSYSHNTSTLNTFSFFHAGNLFTGA